MIFSLEELCNLKDQANGAFTHGSWSRGQRAKKQAQRNATID
jgi:hypothetical protein